MKTKIFCCIITVLSFVGCSNNDLAPTICPNDESRIFTFAVDYTTNKFLGGYQVLLPQYIDTFEMICEYNSPGDFGDVAWFDKTTGSKLFAGTIIWMGKGERTFPEKIQSPSSFEKLKTPISMPAFIPLYHSEYHVDTGTDYQSTWDAIKYLQEVSWLTSSSQAYIYLYQPSVGVGDPADWYWLIFLKY
ncbi:MAG: hypothetical protein LBV72_04410 [Tannerella sp.]|jgi:hypothetical protein|nr:hypothetical protein [Tannerella sp.]